MTYKELSTWIEKNQYSKEKNLTAQRLAAYWGTKYELDEEKMGVLYDLLVRWWHKDNNIGNENHAKEWAMMLIDGASDSECWEIKWEIEE